MSDRFPEELNDSDLTSLQNELLDARRILRPQFHEACVQIEGNLEGKPSYARAGSELKTSLTSMVNAYSSVATALLAIETIRAARAPFQLTGDEPRP